MIEIPTKGRQTAMQKFEVYQDKAGEYRWRLRAANGELLAITEEGFSSKQACKVSIESVRKAAAAAEVADA